MSTVDWQPLSGPLGAQRCGGGDRTKRRLVFLHGFTQTSNSWKPIADWFVHAGHECILVDLPGHGASGNVRADARRAADLVAQVGGEAEYVGYSLGGRIGLHIAVMYPHLVERLVLIGANPGIDDDDERHQRRNADEALAETIEEHGVEAFLHEWVRQPLFAGVTYSDEEIADRLRNTAAGLSSSLRLAGTGAQLSLWPRLLELAMPVCYVAGALDTKYVAVGRQLVAAVADGRLVTVPYAGHAVPTQAPDEVRQAIAAT